MTDQSAVFVHCPRCGAERPADTTFCSRCGTKMTPPTTRAGTASSASSPSPTPPPTGSAPSPPTFRRKVGLWLWAGVVVLVGGMFRILVFHHDLGSGGLSSNPFGPRPLANSLRLYQKGDAWDYRVNGTAILANGRSAVIRDGSLHFEITDFNARGDFKGLTQEIVVNMTATADGRTLPISHTTRETLSQDWIEATTFLMSDNDGPQGVVRTVRQPRVDTPGTWSNGLTQKSHIDFNDGESRDEITTVQGSEVVDTALGRLTVWRCTQDETDSDGTRSTTTAWFAPQIGMPVKTLVTSTLPDGMVMTLNADLTKTTVPL